MATAPPAAPASIACHSRRFLVVPVVVVCFCSMANAKGGGCLQPPPLTLKLQSTAAYFRLPSVRSADSLAMKVAPHHFDSPASVVAGSPVRSAQSVFDRFVSE